jgi:hypothetical protein
MSTSPGAIAPGAVGQHCCIVESGVTSDEITASRHTTALPLPVGCTHFCAIGRRRSNISVPLRRQPLGQRCLNRRQPERCANVKGQIADAVSECGQRLHRPELPRAARRCHLTTRFTPGHKRAVAKQRAKVVPSVGSTSRAAGEYAVGFDQGNLRGRMIRYVSLVHTPREGRLSSRTGNGLAHSIFALSMLRTNGKGGTR